MNKPLRQSPSALLPIARFDTRDIESRFRYEGWKQNMGAVFDMAPPDDFYSDQLLQASIEVADIGGAALARSCGPEQTFSRSEARLAADQLGLILVQYFPRGQARIEGQPELVAGDMMVIDSEQPITIANSDFENITLMVPHDFKDSMLPNVERLHGQRLSGSDPMVALVGEHLQSLWNILPQMDQPQAGTAVRGAMGLMQSLLLKEGSPLVQELAPETSAALGQAVRQYIEQHLSEQITVDYLAKHFRISRAQIYRMFKSHNGVASYIWERRLLRSRRMLASSLFQHYSIGRVAFENGFSSESHFSRAFRSRFAITPSCAREEGVATGLQGNDSCSHGSMFSTRVRSVVEGLADTEFCTV